MRHRSYEKCNRIPQNYIHAGIQNITKYRISENRNHEFINRIPLYGIGYPNPDTLCPGGMGTCRVLLASSSKVSGKGSSCSQSVPSRSCSTLQLISALKYRHIHALAINATLRSDEHRTEFQISFYFYSAIQNFVTHILVVYLLVFNISFCFR